MNPHDQGQMQANPFGSTKKNEFKNDFRSRLNIKGYSLLLEHNNFRKKTAIKLSNNMSVITNTIQVINNLKFIDYFKAKNFGSKIRLFNNTALKAFILYEIFFLGKVFIQSSSNKCELNFMKRLKENYFASTTPSYKEASNSIAKILVTFYLGRLINIYSPKLLFGFIFGDILFKYFSYYESFLDTNKKQVNIFENKLKKLLALNNIDSLPFRNLKVVEFQECTLQKMLVVYSVVKMLHLNFNDNRKFYNMQNVLKIQYLNTKHLKVFFSLYFLGKLSNWFGLIGVPTLDLHNTEGLGMTMITLFGLNKFYLLGFLPIFLFNPYSLFIYSSIKNHLNEEYMKNTYYSKSRMQRIKVMTTFFAINMFFYSKAIYY
jgi:hypothetical protein